MHKDICGMSRYFNKEFVNPVVVNRSREKGAS